MKFKSTLTQMIMYPSAVSKKLCLTPATYYLNFKKISDKFFHGKLIDKLRATGIAAGAVTLLESYLRECYHKMKIGSTESTALKILSGGPQ